MTHFKSFLLSGGIFMFPMVLCSIIGLTIIIERAFALRRKKVIAAALLSEIQQFQNHDTLQRIHDQATSDSTVLSRLIQIILSNLHSTKSETVEAVQVTARAEVLHLERGLTTLEIIVGVGPLLGLLGTVSGLIRVFAEFGRGGESVAEAIGIAAGIAEALNMTVAGLVVAIPALIFHAYYSSRIQKLMTELEGTCLQFIYRIYRTQPHESSQ